MIRSSAWTPEVGTKTTADGLSSPSVITNAEQDKCVEAPIEPPPNFGSPRQDKPPPLPAKKFKKPAAVAKLADQDIVIQPNQIRMTAAQVQQQERYHQQRNKRIRNRSLEMVLDENTRSSDSSPSRQRFLKIDYQGYQTLYCQIWPTFMGV